VLGIGSPSEIGMPIDAEAVGRLDGKLLLAAARALPWDSRWSTRNIFVTAELVLIFHRNWE
jgi:hypothetical protein